MSAFDLDGVVRYLGAAICGVDSAKVSLSPAPALSFAKDNHDRASTHAFLAPWSFSQQGCVA